MARGVAADLLVRASAAAAYARGTGCGIDEATEPVAAGVTRRRFLGATGTALAAGAIRPLDNRLRFDDRFWPQEALNRDWHEWARELFLDAATQMAPWPTLHNHFTAWGRRWDHQSGAEWISQHIPGGLKSDFGRLCVAVVLDEYGGSIEEQSALNLIYLLGLYDSSASGLQPKAFPQLSGTDEKWHVHGGNDQLVRGLHHGLPKGSVRLGERLVALRRYSNGTFTASFAHGHGVRDVRADHVVLTLPFTKLREVELIGVGLPELQRRAIRREELGPNSKIAFQLSRRVWNEQHWTGNLYTDGLVQGGWETTIGQPGPHGIMISLPGGVAGADLGRRYRLKAFEGPAPEAMARDFLRSFDTMFPGLSAAYEGKAYYAWSVNGIQGRPHGNLHFGGEHTSNNFQGYMEGALRSGYRCAREIALT